jgi:uncharacterized glyoxalase superfamily protein PhnB
MAVSYKPEGYHTLTPYIVSLDVAGVIEFLKKTFDAKQRFASATPDGRIMHAEVQVGDSVLMLGGASEQHPEVPVMLYIYLPDVDATYERALAAGATSISPPADQFYGDRHAGVRYAGSQWWIATHIEDVSPEEMARRSAEHMAKQQH